jgi:hypothetical protein
MIPATRPDWSTADLTTDLTTLPEPPASLELLAMADWWTRAVLTSPYGGTARIVDAVTSGLTTRRASTVIAPACKYGRFTALRYGFDGSGAQADTKVNTSSGLAYASAATCPVQGSTAFGEIEQQGGVWGEILGGDDTDTTDGNAALLELPEDLVPTVLLFEVQNVLSLVIEVHPAGQSVDLEAL